MRIRAIVFFIALIQALLFLTHLYVYVTIERFLIFNELGIIAWVRTLFFLLSISFVASSLFTFNYYGKFVKTFYTLSVVWLGTLYWLFWASLISWVAFIAINVSNPDGELPRDAVVALYIGAFIISGYGLWNSKRTKIRNVEIKIKDLPKAWHDRVAVLVSDTHLGNVRGLPYIKKVSKLVQQQKPDIVFMAGDFYDGTITDLAALAKPFAAIKSKLGTYFAPGNHEEFRDRDKFVEPLREAGIKVLQNEKEVVEGVQIIGLDYLDTVDPDQQHQILKDLEVEKDMPSILIKHVPSGIHIADRWNIDLQVSGHTHLGQVFPMRMFTKRAFGKFHHGLNRFKHTQVYTTSGIGTWGPPQRVGTNSELIVITFKKDE